MSSLAATVQKAGEIRLADPRKRREIHSATAMVRACGWVGTGLPEDRARGHDRRKSAVSGSMPDAAQFC
jgi:hypothetical protein